MSRDSRPQPVQKKDESPNSKALEDQAAMQRTLEQGRIEDSVRRPG